MSSGVSNCLIAASEGEGFGLPLIEADQHIPPIVARVIKALREVAGKHAYYFSGTHPNDLAAAVKTWLALHKMDQHPKSDSMPWLTWAQSANCLKEIIFDDQFYETGPDGQVPTHEVSRHDVEVGIR